MMQTSSEKDLEFKLKHAAKYYDIIAVAFVGFLLISNIAATKIIEARLPFISLVFDGGAILFPFTYILGDILSEIYGFKRAKRVIIMGFIMSFLASFIFYLVQISPSGPGYTNQDAFVAVLGFVPRIVIASLCGYLMGQLLNSYVLVWIKKKFGEQHLWVRLIGSTIVGEFADTLIFCTVAFYGIIPGADFINYLITGYLYKCGIECFCLPITYPVLAWVKRHEPAWIPANQSE